MKTALIASLALLAGLVVPAEAAKPTPPEGFEAARKAFADAVAAKDVKAMAGMSRFPLVIDVYQVPPKVTEKQFGKKHLEMFFGDGDEGIVKCIRSGPVGKNNPKEKESTSKAFGDSWYADCDGNTYFFAERDGRWLFIGYQNSNE